MALFFLLRTPLVSNRLRADTDCRGGATSRRLGFPCFAPRLHAKSKTSHTDRCTDKIDALMIDSLSSSGLQALGSAQQEAVIIISV